MYNKKLIIKELNKGKTRLERSLKRAEVKTAELEKSKDKLSQYGYWDLGYHQGAASAHDKAIGIIEDILKLLECEEDKND